MIKDELEFEKTQEQVRKIESALRSLREEVLPLNAIRFAVMAEGYIDTIEMLRNRIDEYIGLKAAREAIHHFDSAIDPRVV